MSARQEMAWIDAWSDLYELLKVHPAAVCLLPDGSAADLETCKGWIQDEAYADRSIALTLELRGGKAFILLSSRR